MFNCLFVLIATQAWAAPVVKVEQGLLRGVRQDRLEVFRGVPFAAPPTGPYRWAPPRDPARWVGERSAEEFGPKCLQSEAYRPKGKAEGSEDCLTLNIWKPKGAAKLPVLVFLHGGIFVWGSSSERINGRLFYDGSALAQQGPAIVVTVNYRLGALGFLAHPSLTLNEGATGNFGLLDQLAALRWVKENIEAFGGDPKKVLLFGESAGAASVLSLLSIPSAKGLFSAALLKSAPLLRDDLARAEAVGRRFAKEAKCEGDPNVLACMRALSPDAVIRASGKILEEDSPRIVFGPNVDGKLLKNSPYESFEKGTTIDVPVIMGTNSEEMNLLVIPSLLKNPIFLRSDYEREVKREFGEVLGAQVLRWYPVEDYLTPLDALKDVFNDAIFHCPADRVLTALAQRGRAPAWRYYFAKSFHLDPFRIMGAFHALDLAFTFQSFAPWYSIFSPSPEEWRLAKEMGAYWTRFANTGDPNSSEKTWPTYGSEKTYLELNAPSRLGNQLRAAECKRWREAGL